MHDFIKSNHAHNNINGTLLSPESEIVSIVMEDLFGQVTQKLQIDGNQQWKIVCMSMHRSKLIHSHRSTLIYVNKTSVFFEGRKAMTINTEK